MTMISSSFRTIAKRFARKRILRVRKNLIWAQIRQQYGRLSVAEAFNQTYRQKLWGYLEGEEFFSGQGSIEEFAKPYTSWLARFITEKKVATVVDLGCGDFRIGRGICAAVSVNYVGVDIVSDLIAYNQSRFGNDDVRFKCADIIEDELPEGDLCLIRQVLQHLSNEQISRVLANCAKFPYLVVTEDVYSGPGVRINLDIMHGPDNRLFRHSGVFLDRAPFSMRTQNVLEIPCLETDSIIRTSLIEGVHNRPHASNG
jgi:SAM-dependent methyltransferase